MRYRKKSDDMSLLRDWRGALQTPHVYRVGSSSVRVQTQCLIALVILFVPLVFYAYPRIMNNDCHSKINCRECSDHYVYNSTYPLTAPSKSSAGVTYKVSIISDLDTDSKVQDKGLWVSHVKKGVLMWKPKERRISLHFDEKHITLSSNIAMKDRGMELSELVTFDGKILTFDDRTGLVFYLERDKIYPWIILMDGDGKTAKGFKSEWAAVKDNLLYVGSMGKEWTTPGGDFVNNHPMWMKIISPRGDVRSVDWTDNYKKLRRAINIEFPGYMLHESGTWSEKRKSWFFLPRRCSGERYNETTDEVMSCNYLLTADEDFSRIQTTKIVGRIPIRGFSSFKFLPDTDDTIIIALKSEEYQGRTATYITAFTIEGEILLADMKIADLKFEGFEFV
ncbi:soluble calcium-activated nucleotidase 1 isoform X2 [Fopius arisanus]|uniref:Apyrase n=1 Tax=Fopius arisanus TaxID=64838 RepID=A0A9R1SWP1_9HYME|nr:PREDICTED: soluble calcium-activated nucleotidase 1 isoform X2 [Fopius arisanus]